MNRVTEIGFSFMKDIINNNITSVCDKRLLIITFLRARASYARRKQPITHKLWLGG